VNTMSQVSLPVRMQTALQSIHTTGNEIGSGRLCPDIMHGHRKHTIHNQRFRDEIWFMIRAAYDVLFAAKLSLAHACE
jgi:hypothetical protein